jgi:putative glutathione S-transferase
MSGFANTVRDSLAEVSADGKFVRVASGYREIISHEHPVYKPEKGRYHLYISYACPWANRCLAVLKLKGLSDVISFTVVHPTWQKTKPNDANDKHFGWAFYDSKSRIPLKNPNGFGSFVADGCEPDPINDAKFVRDLYELSNDQIKKYSVPVLWDKKTSSIVNNESSEIIRMFNSAFNEFIQPASSPYAIHDFAPAHLLKEIDEINDFVYPNINDGVYRSGFAKSQAAYEDAVEKLFRALDRIENEFLSKRRYLLGNTLTESDIRLFMTLVRFDEVYVVYFKCNLKTLMHDYPNIQNYLRELYQIKEIQETISMDHIKIHYYR